MVKKNTFIPIVIIIVAVLATWLIMSNPPKANRGKQKSAPSIVVETLTLKPVDYQVMVESYGTVHPRTQGVLLAQVSGQITYISDQFRDGGFFEKNDILIKLDDRDYQAELKIAQSSLMSARQTLLEEQARAGQALEDWKRLGNGDKPNTLVLREPQMEAAKAKVLSAEAQLEKAELAFERTEIIAPYAGRILKKKVDIGQVITPNSPLADIFAVDYVEIRLPIKNRDLSLLKLPEEFRGQSPADNTIPVTFTSDLIGSQSWTGRLIRTEGAIDTTSQQLYAVAQINDPYGSTNNLNKPIKIGQYVSATIEGRLLENALIIPSNSIYQGSYVYTVKDNILKRRDVEISWQNGTDSLIASGLKVGEELVLTPLGQVSSGTKVSTGSKPSDLGRKKAANDRLKNSGEGK